MRLHGHSETDIALTRCMFQDSVQIRFPDGSLSTTLQPTIGTKQGSIRSPRFYNLILDLALRNAHIPGFRLESNSGPFFFTYLAYADDIAAACEPEDIELTMNILKQQLEKLNQHINMEKTKVLLIMPDAQPDNRDTATGYAERLAKLGITRHLHPDAVPSTIRNGQLICPRGHRKIACPFIDCKFTALTDRKTSPQDLLRNHVRDTHHLPHIQRILCFGTPIREHNEDPRYLRPTPPPSKSRAST